MKILVKISTVDYDSAANKHAQHNTPTDLCTEIIKVQQSPSGCKDLDFCVAGSESCPERPGGSETKTRPGGSETILL